MTPARRPPRRPGRRAALVAAALLAVLPAAGDGRTAAAAAPEAPGSGVALVVWRDALLPIAETYLERALSQAAADRAALVLFELDTPGGLVTTVRHMVSALLASPVPVVVYVSPDGASAASGGVFLLLAADVAVMAPVSDLGAAHPVPAIGPVSAPDAALDKAAHELAALARSLAGRRGRPEATAAALVLESASHSAEEALRLGLIDHIAAGREDLLGWLDGRTVRRADGTEVVLRLTGAAVRPIGLNTRERVLALVSHPLVALFLLAAGLFGLYAEILHPGTLLPGAVGVACLLLFGLASQVLPVNGIGLALIVLGLALLALEVKVVSFGALTAGGLLCLVIGGLVLFDLPPELAVPRSVLAGVAAGLGIVALILVRAVARARRQPHATGREALAGLRGEALTELRPAGKVLVRGEYYDARAEAGVERGAAVEVIGRDGWRLVVRPAPPSDPGRGGR